MPAFPSYVRLQVDGHSEKAASVLTRTEVERGIPRQRRIASDALVTLSLIAIFFSKDDAAAFETWFYTEINAGASWFDWRDPRTGDVRSVRIAGGDIGALEPLRGDWGVSQRAFSIEYVRSAYAS